MQGLGVLLVVVLSLYLYTLKSVHASTLKLEQELLKKQAALVAALQVSVSPRSLTCSTFLPPSVAQQPFRLAVSCVDCGQMSAEPSWRPRVSRTITGKLLFCKILIASLCSGYRWQAGAGAPGAAVVARDQSPKRQLPRWTERRVSQEEPLPDMVELMMDHGGDMGAQQQK
jgi:hypothetical protein